MSNFMKIRPVGAELFHADRQTDMTKLIVAFRNFAKAPKNSLMLSLCPSVNLYQRLMWRRIFMNLGIKDFFTKKLQISAVAEFTEGLT